MICFYSGYKGLGNAYLKVNIPSHNSNLFKEINTLLLIILLEKLGFFISGLN